MSYGNEKALPLMIRVMEAIALSGYPIVFKGAMVLKTLTAQKGLNTSRLTEDIDADWVGKPITNEDLERVIVDAVARSGLRGLRVEMTRDFGERRSAGFNFYIQGRDKALFTMDIGVKGNNFHTSYVTVNGVTFRGSSPQKMYADKISAISTRSVFRRVKDVYDLFLLSYFDGFRVIDINRVLKESGRDLGGFEAFLTQSHAPKGVGYAYGKLEGIENKPPFDVVFNRVKRFCQPYMDGSYKHCNQLWVIDSKGNGSWIQVD